MNAIRTVWEVWTYDVINGQVNDRSCLHREYSIAATVTTYNTGTSLEFAAACPTEMQIREALDLVPNADITVNGDDIDIYVDAASDGCPIGALLCTSHDSLSPIESEE